MNENATIHELYHETRGKSDEFFDFIDMALYAAILPRGGVVFILYIWVGWWGEATEDGRSPWEDCTIRRILNVRGAAHAIRAAIRIFDKLVKDHPNLE